MVELRGNDVEGVRYLLSRGVVDHLFRKLVPLLLRLSLLFVRYSQFLHKHMDVNIKL